MKLSQKLISEIRDKRSQGCNKFVKKATFYVMRPQQSKVFSRFLDQFSELPFEMREP
jgi:hypothetical protein